MARAVSPVRIGEFRAITSLGIQQDRFNKCLHVAAHAGAIVRKHSNNAADVFLAGIGSDQPLDQLATDERTDIRMIEKIVDSRVDV